MEEERAEEDSRGRGEGGSRGRGSGSKLGVRAMPDPAVGSNPVASPDTSFNSDR